MSELRYDTGAAEYDRMFADVTRKFIPMLLSSARVAEGYHILDIATGTGLAAEAAAEVVAPTDMSWRPISRHRCSNKRGSASREDMWV
jgi:ubiquinone/menaquinone biosynthesis C-methylase UbiE